MSPAAGGITRPTTRRFSRIRRRQQQFKVFWIGVGEDDTLSGPGRSEAARDAGQGRGSITSSRESEGRHEWTVWRHHLNEVAGRLFK